MKSNPNTKQYAVTDEIIHICTTHNPSVIKLSEDLDRLNTLWASNLMLAKINHHSIDSQLIHDFQTTQKEFQSLRGLLLRSIVEKYINKIFNEIHFKSQTQIDILNRNLFERTADIGFLSQDIDIVDYLSNQDSIGNQRITNRLKNYQQKYSVYRDILIMNQSGEVIARLDEQQPLGLSDPRLEKLSIDIKGYLEYFGASTLFDDNTNRLLYTHEIYSPQHEILGYLVLEFNYLDEMSKIMQSLMSPGFELVLLDKHHQIATSSNPTLFKPSTPFPQKFSTEKKLRLLRHHNHHYLYIASQAQGFQDYYGDGWISLCLINIDDVFENTDLTDTLLNQESYPHDLSQLNLKMSASLLRVILNGKITSIQKNALAFIPILDAFKLAGDEIKSSFNEAISSTHQLLSATLNEVLLFSADLAAQIMDRNLYERANDCRWWSQSSTFTSILSQAQTSPLNSDQKSKLEQTLADIHQLYTVYAALIIYDKTGRILATSGLDSRFSESIYAQGDDVTGCLSLNTPNRYHVSPFEPSPYYQDKPTYIYHAPIYADNQKTSHSAIGGIAIVFDSQNQFYDILNDTLPNAKYSGAIASLFVDNTGYIISVTDNDLGLKVADRLVIPSQLKSAGLGEKGVMQFEISGRPCLCAFKVSEGYREFKKQDGYQNHVISLCIITQK
jgi:hypothetical protein